MYYNRINNITGWIVCAIATTTYLLSMEPTASLWDCGEFISSCYKIEIPHPPGAPLFILIGRLFVIIFGSNPDNAALAVNTMSAVMSGLTVLFLFWTITFFARRLVDGAEENGMNTFLTMGAGVVGALGYAFSDSFWFSAVEGEVYASSSFFTALVFWAILKWEHRADQPGADKWIVFIFYVIGLSIGVHLLNLLAIPALVMVYYFRRYKGSTKGAIIAFIVGCIITGFIQSVVIQYSLNAASWFDILFVNDFELPFFTGFAFFFLLLAGIFYLVIRHAGRKKMYKLALFTWSIIFILFGYSTYITTMIRSNADPGVDMFNVDNPVSLKGYLAREQYPDWPVLYGPDFTDAAPFVDKGDLYIKGEKKYEVAGKIKKQDWGATPSSHFFPRMWDNDNDRQQQACYRQFAGLDEGEAPTMGDNMKYFFNYQAGFMYMRYFMWNFAGRQNDIQGFGNARDSNWISGVPFIDNAVRGDQSQMPDSAKTHNNAYNRLFMLPFLIGVAGMIYQFRRSKQDFLVNMLLFFFTGLAIVIYLNQAGFQPRERDYAYVGSFYAFAIWIGLGVIALNHIVKKITSYASHLPSPVSRLPTYAYAKASAYEARLRNASAGEARLPSPVSRLPSYAYAKASAHEARLPTFVTAIVTFLAVPVLMLHEGWDDHDRSDKTLAVDMARNYLESCPKDAILFTFEDNDTYPLWYAQEVEGVRPDVRVIVNTLAGSDWFMNQLRYKVNESRPFNILFTKEQVQGDNRQVMYYVNMPGYDANNYYDLRTTFKDVFASDDPKFLTEGNDGGMYHIFPMRKFSVPVNKQQAIAAGAATTADNVVSELRLDLSAKNYLLRGDLLMLALVASNDWSRPICFTSPSGVRELGLEKYLRQEGMTYRLVPVENSGENINVNVDVAYNNLMKKFRYGAKGKKGIYYDEENRRRLNYMRLAHAQIAMAMVNAGEKEKAAQVLRHFDAQYDVNDYPYGMISSRGNQHNAISLQFLQACYLAGEQSLVNKIEASVRKDLQQQLQYYNSLGELSMNDETLAANALSLLRNQGSELGDRQAQFANDILSSYQLLRQMDDWKKGN